jgi:hypothetical protein
MVMNSDLITNFRKIIHGLFYGTITVFVGKGGLGEWEGLHDELC